MFEDLRLSKSEQAFHYYIEGDKHRRPEPPEIVLHFPGGHVSVMRCSDSEYWAHLSLERVDEESGNRYLAGTLIDSRIDCKAQSTSQADRGDLARPDLFHLALKVKTNH